MRPEGSGPRPVSPWDELALMADAALFARERCGFEPDRRQAEVLRFDGRRVILNCTRQWGKSTVTAVKAVHRAVMEPDSFILVVTPSERQSLIFLRKAAELVRRLGSKVRGDGDNEISLLLPNGSRIVGLPGKERRVRGFSEVSLLVIDEASRVEEPMYHAVRPMLAVGDGDLGMLSTPYGQQGFFHRTWMSGDAEWVRVEVRAQDCPRISPRFLEEERAELGERCFRQEYECEFVGEADSLLQRECVERAMVDAVEPLYGAAGAGRRQWSCGREYVLGLDLGKQRDYTAIAVLERRVELTGEIDWATYARARKVWWDVVHLERLPLGTAYVDVARRVGQLTRSGELRGQVRVVMDATGVGSAVVEMLRQGELGCRVIPVTITGGEKVNGDGVGYRVPRKELLHAMTVMLEQGDLRIGRRVAQAERLEAELRSLRVTAEDRIESDGGHDDLVFATALGCWWGKTVGRGL